MDIFDPKRSGGDVVTPGGGSQGNIAQSDLSRMLPRQISTGSTRGVQTVGYGTVKIDGTNNRITIGDTDGSSIGMGSIPSTVSDTGFFALDTSGQLVWKQVGPTSYTYDPSNDYVNNLQLGLLPDGSTGMVSAKAGITVASLFV